MTVAEFHVEPQIRRIDLTGSDTPTDISFEPERLIAGVESLLFSLRFRNWLSDSEKNLLDMLAPSRAVSFLIHNRHYLHPEEIDLFPMDVIDSSLHRGGEAIFIHRYYSSADSDSDCSKIHTARVGQLRGEDIILGMLAPDQLASTGQYDRYFERIVDIFRSAWRSTENAAGTLADRVTEDSNQMIINRASGRVIVAGRSLATCFRARPREITDIETGELLQTARRTDPQAELQLDNVTADHMHLAVGEITCRRSTAGPDARGDQAESSFMIHGIRNRLTAISAAAGHLGTLLRETATPEQLEMLAIIQNETESVDRYLDQLRLLLYCDRLPTTEVPLADEVEMAATSALSIFGANARIEYETSLCRDRVVTVPGAIRSLIEAVLRSHLGDPRQQSHTIVTVAAHNGDNEVRIASASGRPDCELLVSKSWQSCARQLAGQLQLDFEHSAEPDRRLLVTTITVAKPETEATQNSSTK